MPPVFSCSPILALSSFMHHHHLCRVFRFFHSSYYFKTRSDSQNNKHTSTHYVSVLCFLLLSFLRGESRSSMQRDRERWLDGLTEGRAGASLASLAKPHNDSQAGRLSKLFPFKSNCSSPHPFFVRITIKFPRRCPPPLPSLPPSNPFPVFENAETLLLGGPFAMCP